METATELASMKQETAAKLAETATELMTIKQEARENFKRIDTNFETTQDDLKTVKGRLWRLRQDTIEHTNETLKDLAVLKNKTNEVCDSVADIKQELSRTQQGTNPGCTAVQESLGNLQSEQQTLKQDIKTLIVDSNEIRSAVGTNMTKIKEQLTHIKQKAQTIEQQSHTSFGAVNDSMKCLKTEILKMQQKFTELKKDINDTNNSSQCQPQTLQQLQTIESNTQTVLETLEVLSRRNTSGYPMSTQQCPPRWPIDNTTVSVPIQNIAQTCSDIARRNPNSPQGYYQLRNQEGSTTLVRCPEQHRNPCSEIALNFPSSPSGYYEVRNSRGQVVRVYCNMTKTFNKTGALRGWMSVANLNMNDPNQHCPNGLSVHANPSSCGLSGHNVCDSVIFPVHGVWYRRVCGKMIGYQRGYARAFWNYWYYRNSRSYRPWSLDSDNYVDGATLTYGSQRNRSHIWTFAVSESEDDSSGRFSYLCPCARTTAYIDTKVPPFIGSDYFCDTGSARRPSQATYYQDPLWDGRGCGSTSSCCTLNSPPYFCKELPQPTTEDIELRLCKYGSTNYGDITIEQIELYIS